jgi:hypothetical protein
LAVSPPYYQTNIEGTRKDNAFRTLQGAMARMEKEPKVTGTIYFVPAEGDQAYVLMRYLEGEIEEDVTTLVKPEGWKQ